jgi:hypothetical protein
MHTPSSTTPRRRVVGISAVVAATLALAPITGGTALAAPESNHCFTPAGTDANEILGVAQQLLVFEAPAESGCASVSAGESWTPLAGAMFWIANTSFEVVPAGYEPFGATPMEDFQSKAETITYVIDAGTARERTHRFRVRDIVKVDTVDEFFAFDPASAEPWPKPYPIAQFLAKLPPLAPGQHTYTAVLQMSARTCDGLGTTDGLNCIGPGAFVLCTLPFTVTPRTPARRT